MFEEPAIKQDNKKLKNVNKESQTENSSHIIQEEIYNVSESQTKVPIIEISFD